MITIYTITYNEAFMLPHFISHYRSMFPGCRIVVYDNESTDNTVAIAKAAGCEIIPYSTNNQLSDKKYLEIKNNCWKNAKTNWVLIADCDELCDINAEQLQIMEDNGVDILTFVGWNMVNMADDMNLEAINTGVRAPSYDKLYCFNKRYVREINYGPGAHNAQPLGNNLKTSANKFRCRHYKYLHPDYMVKRHAEFAKRLSDDNLKHGYGGHYQYTEEQIRAEFAEVRKNAIKIL